MRRSSQYEGLIRDLSKLLKSCENVSFANDDAVLTRILDLLSLESNWTKIHGLIYTTEVTTYGGHMIESEVERIHHEIITWWEARL